MPEIPMPDMMNNTDTMGNFVQGDAIFTADFAAANTDIRLVNIMGRTTQALHADINWMNVPMAGGAFKADAVQGQFHDRTTKR
jgi:hypothetical protein